MNKNNPIPHFPFPIHHSPFPIHHKPFPIPHSLLALCLSLGLSASAQTTTGTNTTDIADSLSPTNIVIQPLPPITNLPSLIPPKQPYTPGGATIRSTFSGKFVVPGRTLKLPAPEAADSQPRPDGWNRALTFGMNMTQGNSETLRYGLGLDAAREREQNTTRVRARAAYGESDEQKDTENATALLRYDRQINRRFYALADMDWLTDTIADIDYRIIGILSPGVHLWRTDRTVCKLELGAGYLAEKKGTGQDAFAAGRAAAVYERILNDHVLVWATTEYFPKLADTEVFYLNTEVGLVAMLTRDLNLNLMLENRYDNAPAEGRSSSDLILTTSFSLKF